MKKLKNNKKSETDYVTLSINLKWKLNFTQIHFNFWLILLIIIFLMHYVTTNNCNFNLLTVSDPQINRQKEILLIIQNLSPTLRPEEGFLIK